MSSDSTSAESLSLERREEGFALVRIDRSGNRAELVLSESNVLLLPKLFQETIHKILAGRSSQAMKAHGVSPIAAVPVARIQLNTDVHRSEILLTIFDKFGNGSGFAIPFDIAQAFSARLPPRVTEIAQQKGKPS